jgi:hypothetical protein
MFAGMDQSLPTRQALVLPPRLPGWAMARGSEADALDAAFAAGAALKSLDEIVQSAPVWAGCWRARQALRCAAAAVRLAGRDEDAAALRDSVLMTPAGGDPGPAGRVFVAFRRLASRKTAMNTATIAELAGLLGLAWNDRLEGIADQAEAALHSGRAAPFAAATLVRAIHARHPEAEALAWALGDALIAAALKWDHPVPLLMGERYGAAFRTSGGRGRVTPDETGFERAVCLALVDAVGAALRSAGEIARRADDLLAVAPKVRTRGGGRVIRALLEEDALSATAPGLGLSRWASTRLFERLESLEAVRELSGRQAFRLYGL